MRALVSALLFLCGEAHPHENGYVPYDHATGQGLDMHSIGVGGFGRSERPVEKLVADDQIQFENCAASSEEVYSTSESLCGSQVCHTTRMTTDMTGYRDGPSFCTARPKGRSPWSRVMGSYQIMAKGMNWFSSEPSAPEGAAEDLPGANFGMYYNAVDDLNFDFCYVRVDNGDYCIQAGYTVDGVATYYQNDFKSASGKCPSTAASEGAIEGSTPYLESQQWYDLQVDVIEGEKATIKINSGVALSLEPHYPLNHLGGMLMAQASAEWQMTDTTYFKDFHIHALHEWKMEPMVKHCSEDSKPSQVDSDVLCDTVEVSHTGFTHINKCTVLKLHGTGDDDSFCNTIPGKALPFEVPYDMSAHALNWKSGTGDDLSIE